MSHPYGYRRRDDPRSRLPVPAGDGNASFNAVSCLSATRCLAVGETGAGSSLFSNAAFTGFWNGRKWRLVPAS